MERLNDTWVTELIHRHEDRIRELEAMLESERGAFRAQWNLRHKAESERDEAVELLRRIRMHGYDPLWRIAEMTDEFLARVGAKP